MADLLLVRGADLVLLGVGWSGLRFVGGEGPGQLHADEGGGRITLTFPPQAVAEGKYDDDFDLGGRGARLGGPSRVGFEVAAGTTIELTAAALFGALADADVVVGEGADSPTSIELPWHLAVAPRAPAGARVASAQRPMPVASPAGVVGLWRAQLRSRGAGETDAGLALLPLAADQSDDGLDLQPLSGAQRQSILDAAHAATGPALARARRLELSALGGSLAAELSAPSLEWSHRTVLGRDDRVRVVQYGVLYPFGHRAAFIESAERRFHPSGSPAVAGLRREVLLVVLEPVRSTADGDTELRRRFPFSEVEVLETNFAEIKPPEEGDYLKVRRPVEFHGELGERIEALAGEQQQLEAEVGERLSAQPGTLAAFEEMGLGSVPQLLAAREGLAAAGDPEGWRQANEAIDKAIEVAERRRNETTTGPEGEPIGPDQGTLEAITREIQELEAGLHSQAEIQQAEADRASFGGEVGRLQAAVESEFNSLPRTIHDAALQGDEQAQTAESLGARIGELREQITSLGEAEEKDHQFAFIPRTRDGRPLAFPLRCAAANGDVPLSVPLVFVADLTLEPGEFLPEFRALESPLAAQILAEAWQEHADVTLPGTAIDMVNSGQPRQPGDLHEVHALSLAGVAHEGGFRPRVEQFEVALPALRSLLPETDVVRTLQFTKSFLEDENIPELPFALDDDAGVLADFVKQADRSGGLVSPRFLVDGISRSLGPVAMKALPPELAQALPAGVPKFDLESVYEGATLLGFPLTSLLKLPQNPLAAATDELPLPPEITQLVEAGIPTGTRMSWTLDLAEQGPFRPGPATKLVLTVECSTAKQETTCTVDDFSLVLPPDGAGSGLLTLHFRSLAFTQRQGRAPDLTIDGMTLGFGGALALIQELQQELQKTIDLPDNLPKVDVRPDGLSAGYGISAPAVTAGAFALTNIAMHAGVDVPFDGEPVTVSLSFASKDDPFNVSVLAFGGGGYLDLTLGPHGVLRLEASIDFGASIEVDFLVARGEVHALGGVRFRQLGGSIAIDGFLDIGGSVEVLGLVSASIELVVTLTYTEEEGKNRLVGRATIVLEIDLTLFSESVEIDSGEWVLAGSEHSADRLLAGPEAGAAPADRARDAWREYREAFAPA
ncbi:MAG TPA: hypothetical protein VN522_00575 [Solirubrobacterales bacterium]|nr:hypothetical protein [Solirubrobacterales bacterium]